MSDMIPVRSAVYCVHAFKVIRGKVVGANLRQNADGKEYFVYSVKPEDPKDVNLYGVLPMPEHRITMELAEAKTIQRREQLNRDVDCALAALSKILRTVQEVRDAGDTLPRNPDTGRLRMGEKLEKMSGLIENTSVVLADVKMDGYTRKGKGRHPSETPAEKEAVKSEPQEQAEPVEPETPRQPTTLGLALDKALEESSAAPLPA